MPKKEQEQLGNGLQASWSSPTLLNISGPAAKEHAKASLNFTSNAYDAMILFYDERDYSGEQRLGSSNLVASWNRDNTPPLLNVCEQEAQAKDEGDEEQDTRQEAINLTEENWDKLTEFVEETADPAFYVK